MDSASTLLHAHCGSPTVAECSDIERTACWHCGGSTTRGQLVMRWMGRDFVGQNRIKAPHSQHVCEACIWVMARSSDVPHRPAQPGQQCGPNFRNFSHMLDARGYVNASKGEKPTIRDWLRAPKAGRWFAAIAESGQKHVIPYAPINIGATGGRIQFEEQVVALPRDDAGWRIVDTCTSLLTLGATKESVASGQYTPGEWQRCGEAIRAFERDHAGARHSTWFVLVVWLAQRDEEAVAARMAAEKEAKSGKARRGGEGSVSGGDGARAARPAGGVPRKRGERAQALGPATGPDASRDAHDEQRAGVAHVDAAVAPTWSAGQLGLWSS